MFPQQKINFLLKQFNLASNTIVIKRQNGVQITAKDFLNLALETSSDNELAVKLGIPYDTFRKYASGSLKWFKRTPRMSWGKYFKSFLPSKITEEPAPKKKTLEEKKLEQKSYNKNYYQKNKEYFKAKNSAYKAAKAQRMPAWADKQAIASFYKNCPAGYHVDHIIPLRGDLVSGLHVLNNLQYLPAEENIKKSNRFNVYTQK